MYRRELLRSVGLSTLAGWFSSATLADSVQVPESLSVEKIIEIERLIRERMRRDHIPGLGACILNRDDLIWSDAYGWSDLQSSTPMTLDSIQNIASISKTVTATAVLQLFEEGVLDLDEDISELLGFPVRHPRAPSEEITSFQLLTHTSSIADGLAYSSLYACGDPRLSLDPWLREYFTPGGAYYDADLNFHTWTPRDNQFRYCNLAYGLLARIVETVSGTPFDEFCHMSIFDPLQMSSTSWRIADIDESRHVTPYSWVENGEVRGPNWGGTPLGAIQQDGPTHETLLADGFQPNCVYGHPNFPDGFLRTTITDLSKYARAYLGGGAYAGHRILEAETVATMLESKLMIDRNSPVDAPKRNQGLTWSADKEVNGELAWGHGGSDPGVNTDLRILLGTGWGVIVFTNTNGIDPWDISHRLLEIAAT